MDHSNTLRNIIVIFIIGVLTAAVGYVLRIYVARNYSVEDYGMVYSLIAFFSFVLVFLDMGLSQSIVKEVSYFRAKKKFQHIRNLFFTTLMFQLILTGIFSIILYIFSNQISDLLFHLANTVSFRIMLVWFLTAPFQVVVVAYLMSYEKTTWYALSSFFSMATTLLLSVVLTILHVGISAICIGYAVTNILLFIILFAIDKDFFKGSMSYRFSLVYPDTLKYGFFIAIGVFSWTIITQSDTMVITVLRGLKDAGLYQAAIPLANTLTLITTPISTVMFSSVASLWAKGRKADISELFVLVYKYSWIVILPLVFILSVFSKKILLVVFGSEYLIASNTLTILAFSFMFLSLSIITTSILAMIGEAKYSAKIVLTFSALNLLGNIVLVRIYGIVGAAIATVISCSLIFFFLTRVLLQKLDIHFPIKDFLKILFASIVFVLVVFVLRTLPYTDMLFYDILIILISFVIYIILLLVLKTLSYQDFLLIKSIVIRKK